MAEVERNRVRHTVVRGLLATTFFVIAPTVLFAQENASFLMHSGEPIAGQLIDMGGGGFTVLVAREERQVAVEDVAEIEFGDPGHPIGDGSQASPRSSTQGQAAVWLRDGDVVEGELYDIDGSRPLRITVRTSTGERQFSSAEIRKIVLADNTGALRGSIQGSSPR